MNGIWQVGFAALFVIVGFGVFLLAGALRQIGLLQLRLGDDPGALITDGGLDRGTVAPDFEGLNAGNGQRFRLSDMPAARRLMVFLTPGCLACRKLVPSLNEIASARRDVALLTICRGDFESCTRFATSNGLRTEYVVDITGEAERLYEVGATPFAYLISESGNVLIRGIANDWRHLESLIEEEGTYIPDSEEQIFGEFAPRDAESVPGGVS